mmetsp:Transcript_33241/g.107359  ORF Transcript_33241/g.107359 Transcript_33241/m.107359 type:complete len:248 (+) Transcript_33241:383-1126(+)
MALARGGEHLELPLDKLDDGDGGVARAAVDEGDVGRLVGGQVGLVDAVREGGGGAVVHQPQHVQADDLGGVEHSAPLDVSEVCGHGEHDVGDGGALVALGDALQRLEEHGKDALRGEDGLLAAVVDGDADVARDVDHLVRYLRHLGLDLVRVELFAHDGLEARHCVGHVGRDPAERSLAELPLAAREADHARCGPFGHLIVKDVNAAAPGDRDNSVGVADVDADARHTRTRRGESGESRASASVSWA